MTVAGRGILLAAIMSGAGCGRPAPRPLTEGSDVCAHCHMTLADRRFGGELVSRTGKVTPFDDVGCLAVAVATGDSAAVHSLWVSDYLAPDSLVNVTEMRFLKVDSLRTPMGYGYIAVRPGRAADSLAAALGGRVMAWEDVMTWARAPGR